MNKNSKGDRFDYFEAYRQQAQYAQEIILNLASAFRGGELGTWDLMTSLHTVENDADEVNHLIQDRLLVDFVVPMDRGSMASLAHALDDVCDAVEQIAIDAYTHKFEVAAGEPADDLAALAALLEEASSALCSAAGLLVSLGKSRHEIKRLCVEVQTCESRADEIHIDSVRALYDNDELDDRACRVRQEILDAFEEAMDSMENAAERIESIVAENV